MGQEEVLKILEKNKGWMLAAEIQRELDQNRGLVDRALRNLYKHGEIMKKEASTRKRKINIWKSKE